MRCVVNYNEKFHVCLPFLALIHYKIPKKGNLLIGALVGFRFILTIKKTVVQHDDLKTDLFFLIGSS